MCSKLLTNADQIKNLEEGSRFQNISVKVPSSHSKNRIENLKTQQIFVKAFYKNLWQKFMTQNFILDLSSYRNSSRKMSMWGFSF